MGAFTKTAFCTGAKCNQARPYRRAPKGRGKVCLFCGDPVQMPSKYRNEPTRSKHTGRMYQSRKEARREPTLLALQNAGAICELRYQVPYRLELYATGAVDELLTELERWADLSGGFRTVERLAGNVRRSRQMVCTYRADFVHKDREGRETVEDVKSVATNTALYRIKKRLMSLAHNVEIVEPEEGGIQQKARGAGVHGRGTGSRLMGGR
jgi:hypothetical protein